MGRNRGRLWAALLATGGRFSWPPMGTSYWPLTAVRDVLNDREFLGVYRAHLEQQNTVQSAA